MRKAPRGRNLKLEDRHASFTMPGATAKAKARPLTMYETVPAFGVVLIRQHVSHSQAKLRPQEDTTTATTSGFSIIVSDSSW